MRRAFKTVFYIRGNYLNKEGKCAIMTRICLDKDRISIGTTGICIKPDLWDPIHQNLKGRTVEALQVNKKLEGIRAELQAISEKLEFEDTLTLEKVKAIYQHTDGTFDTIGKVFDKYINNVKEQVGISMSEASYEKYSLCRERFMAMLKSKYHCSDMALKELNPTVMQDYGVYLMTVVGQGHNTAMKALKTLKTIILYAIKLGVLHANPFLGVKIHMEPVDRGFLTEEEIAAMMKKEFDIPRLELVRDIFIFSCFTGLAYIDVKYLDKDNIVPLNGKEWIIDNRIKTHTHINVLLFDGAKRILKKYEDDPRCKGHLLPILSNQKMNLYLKEIAAACGIDKELTFHMARHSFATLALSKGVPIESVSRMLGHTNIRTTQIYARITNKKIESDMSKFFEDKGIMNLDAQSVKMTKKEDKSKSKKEVVDKAKETFFGKDADQVENKTEEAPKGKGTTKKSTKAKTRNISGQKDSSKDKPKRNRKVG